jgi:methylated-DNA-[protein]-cysteine S-methyltransferase
MTTTYYSYLDSPLGPILLRGDGQFVTGLFLPRHKRGPEPQSDWRRDDGALALIRAQLTEYFAGERDAFDVPLRLSGTPFQQRVWQELTRIPYGTTISYGQLAKRVGRPTASRAVGAANGRNPVSIIVPCHRVIGAGGQLTGYGGGLENKEWLLAWERSHAAGEPASGRAQRQKVFA